MGFRLEELRRRARDQELIEEIGHAGSRLVMEAEGGNVESRGGGAAIKPMAEAVAKIFEQTKAFKPRFDELNDAIEQIERLGEATARTFAPLKAFQSHLVYLVASLDSIRQFQSNL